MRLVCLAAVLFSVSASRSKQTAKMQSEGHGSTAVSEKTNGSTVVLEETIGAGEDQPFLGDMCGCAFDLYMNYPKAATLRPDKFGNVEGALALGDEYMPTTPSNHVKLVPQGECTSGCSLGSCKNALLLRTRSHLGYDITQEDIDAGVYKIDTSMQYQGIPAAPRKPSNCVAYSTSKKTKCYCTRNDDTGLNDFMDCPAFTKRGIGSSITPGWWLLKSQLTCNAAFCAGMTPDDVMSGSYDARYQKYTYCFDDD